MKKKDVFWFQHDSNAKDDPKCMLLIDQLGPEGYGIYWILVEILRDQPDYTYPLAMLPIVARRFNTTAEKVKAVVLSYGLFEVQDDKFFFSESLMRRMAAYNELKAKRSQAALVGNRARWKGIANASQADSKRIANGCDCDAIASRIDKSRVDKNINNIIISSNEEISDTDESASAEIASNNELFPTDNISSQGEIEIPLNSKKGGKEVVIPYHIIQDRWNRLIEEQGTTFSKVVNLSEARKNKIAVRWKEMSAVGNPAKVIETIFLKAGASKFLQGDNNRGWKLTFDWLFENSKNWVKVYEGQYDDRMPQKAETANNDKNINDLW